VPTKPMTDISLAYSCLGLLLGPIINRLSTATPAWVAKDYDDSCLVKTWPQWEPLISIECGLILALIPLLISNLGPSAYGLKIAFCWTLVLLAMIDARSMLLPDILTLPLLVLGILASNIGYSVPISYALIGASTGYSMLWLLNRISILLNGAEGMGQGDMKLLAAIGAWQGYMALPTILVVASTLGVCWGLARRTPRSEPFPFGPMLCFSGIFSAL